MEPSSQSIFNLCKELESEMMGKHEKLPIIAYNHILHVRQDVEFVEMLTIVGSALFSFR